MTETILSVLVALLTALVGSILSILAVAVPFKRRWNAVLVAQFGVPHIDYVQAAGLLALVALATAAANGVRIAIKFRSVG